MRPDAPEYNVYGVVFSVSIQVQTDRQADSLGRAAFLELLQKNLI